MHTSPFIFARCGVRVSPRPLTLALALALGSTPLAGLAATISVFTGNDAGGATDCTLRQAIVSMNTSSVSGTGCVNSGGAFGTGDAINFAPPDFPQFQTRTITLADAGTSTLSISDASLAITAGDYAGVTIERPAGASNAFGIVYDSAPAGGSLTLANISMSNGKVNAATCSGKAGGGAICMVHADLTLANSTLSGNFASYGGGAIFSRSGNVTVTHSTLSSNTATFGGAIYASNNTLAVTDSTLGGNGSGAYHSYGGGIFSQSAAVTLTGSTLSGNTVGYAGAIWSWSGNITLVNSTLSGNFANAEGNNPEILNSGGIFASSGSVALTNSTVSGNAAPSHSGGISSPNPILVINSIIAGNTAPSGDIEASLDPGSMNNIIGGDPKLGALANNGGPTSTMLPLVNSPAIEAGSDAACPATDQRTVKRPQGAHCDIGAVEVLIANPNRLFTNWSSGINFSGPLYTGGGDCSGSCFGIGDNFSNGERWLVTDISVYMVLVNGYTGGNWRYALFTEAGAQVVAPTDAFGIAFTDLGPFIGYGGYFEVYKGVISGLNIDLLPGNYQLRFTNTQVQSVYPAFGVSTSPQSVSPGFFQLTGSGAVESLLSTDVTQRDEEWAFDLSGSVLSIFKNGFEGP